MELKADAAADIERQVDLVLRTELVYGGTLGLYLSTENVDIVVDSNNLTDDHEGCETSKSEEHIH